MTNPTHSGVYLHPAMTAQVPNDGVHAILELGAGDGLDALALSAHFRAPVYTFECNPLSLELCQANLRDAPGVQLVPKAAWNETKPIPFHTATHGNPFASSCLCPNPAYPFEAMAHQTIVVDATRLDEWLTTAGPSAPIDLLCMDLQGATLHALEGMGSCLDRVKYIITEVGIQPIYQDEPLLEPIHAFLHQKGFHLKTRIQSWLDGAGQWQEHINTQEAPGTPSWFADCLFVRA